MSRTAPYLPDTAPFTAEQRAWFNGFFASMASAGAAVTALPTLPFASGDGHTVEPVMADPPPRFSRANPFPSRLTACHRLSGAGSAKDTRHIEISLEGSGLTYEVGDALGVVPQNCPDLVDGLIAALGLRGDEVVPSGKGVEVLLRDAFLLHYEITTPSKVLLEALVERARDEDLRRLLQPEHRADLSAFLWGRDVLDLVLAYPSVRWTPASFVETLRPLQHRLYSISSSLKAFPGAVHLTVGTVRYTSFGRARKGVCSTFLADLVTSETPLPVFVHANPSFRLPPDPSTPIIMIGPGTGIAPFRAFLHERRATEATGKTWLFFGDQHAATDFLYRAELDAMLADGTLTRLDTAFSRDQAEKVYVQHRMLERANELYAWLEEGAHLYVCGDASRMAKDVDTALHQVIEQVGGLSSDNAFAYMQRLKREKRYARDVY